MQKLPPNNNNTAVGSWLSVRTSSVRSTEPSPQQNASSSTAWIHSRAFHVGCHLSLRLLSELCEFNKPLHVAYVDIKSAFDLVDREALWKAVRSTAALTFLVDLIRALLEGTRSPTRYAGRLLPYFLTSGVRQGCILASVAPWILSWDMLQMQLGYNLPAQHITYRPRLCRLRSSSG